MTDSSNKLVLLPAVDVADGKAVRLVQGEAGTETDYGSPIDAAQDFENRGAEWIHLVDLDAAFGRGSNSDLLNQVVKAVGIKVELSGGIRDTESLERALDTGAERVNIGTAALENPEWTAEMISRFGDQVAIGLDVRGTTLAARGWTQEGGEEQLTPSRGLLVSPPMLAPISTTGRPIWYSTCCTSAAAAPRNRATPWGTGSRSRREPLLHSDRARKMDHAPGCSPRWRRAWPPAA